MGDMTDSPANVEEAEDLVKITVESAMEAWQWIIDHGGVLNEPPEAVRKTTVNLGRACEDGRTHLFFIMNHVSLTPNEKMLFKLIFAG